MNDQQIIATEFDYSRESKVDLIVCAGGFEDRAIAFLDRLRTRLTHVRSAVLLKYASQSDDNDAGFERAYARLVQLLGKQPVVIEVDSDRPVFSASQIARAISESAAMGAASAIVDISGMTHLWALCALEACSSNGLNTRAVYTEASGYYPLAKERAKLLKAWSTGDFELAREFLPSTALKAVHILPQFGGNFRPQKDVCLFVFAGFEPNRALGLVDLYSPGALVVAYGRSPYERLAWRTDLSRQLHRNMFKRWRTREIEVSTINVGSVLECLEKEFHVIRDEYDVAIAPQCSKMQALASYLFWRRHPEVQLVFTSPVRFAASRYSHGSGLTYDVPVSSS